MDALVCGLHRSGTSVVAHLLAAGCDRSLLDDPSWAMSVGLINLEEHLGALGAHDVVKCPRMGEILDQVMLQTAARTIVVIRDPRDVWCSILEKVRTGRPTRMLDYGRLGVAGHGIAAFGHAAQWYFRGFERMAGDARIRDRIRFVVYERFFRSRLECTAGMARWLEWDFDQARAKHIVDMQLGPEGNKDDLAIKGPTRWVDELTSDDAAVLHAATLSYSRLTQEVSARALVVGGP